MPPDLTDLGDLDPLQWVRPVNESLSLGKPVGNWERVAEWLSRTHAGMFLAGDRGVTWRLGSRTWWLMDPDALPAVEEARCVAAGLGVECGWSIGSVAGRLVKHVGKPPGLSRDRERLASGVAYNYIECTPGQYDHCDHYDVSAYYYSMLCRLPSLRLTVLSSGKLVWGRMDDCERERWEAVKAAIAPCKWLRNAMVGCMVGRSRGRVYYHRGERRHLHGDPGPWATAAWAVVRAGWEVTRRVAVETEAVWAHTDAVICPGGLYPGTWDRLGFRVKQEGSGPAEVCSPINYAVGPVDRTAYYRRGSRYRMPHERPPAPDREYHRQWLRDAS